MTELIKGNDRLTRCGWCGTDPDYVRYHDTEWGETMYAAMQSLGLVNDHLSGCHIRWERT